MHLVYWVLPTLIPRVQVRSPLAGPKSVCPHLLLCSTPHLPNSAFRHIPCSLYMLGRVLSFNVQGSLSFRDIVALEPCTLPASNGSRVTENWGLFICITSIHSVPPSESKICALTVLYCDDSSEQKQTLKKLYIDLSRLYRSFHLPTDRNYLASAQSVAQINSTPRQYLVPARSQHKIWPGARYALFPPFVRGLMLPAVPWILPTCVSRLERCHTCGYLIALHECDRFASSRQDVSRA